MARHLALGEGIGQLPDGACQIGAPRPHDRPRRPARILIVRLSFPLIIITLYLCGSEASPPWRCGENTDEQRAQRLDQLPVRALGPAVTIRDLSDEAHRALKVRAAQPNRSTEAEIRAILEAAVRPEDRLRIGTARARMSRKIGLTNADVEALEHARDSRPAEPMRLE